MIGMHTYIVWHPDGGEDGPSDGIRFIADSHEEAAHQWAERYDRNAGDYPLAADDQAEIVHVKLLGNDAVLRRFRVRAIPSVSYLADEITNDTIPSVSNG
jgi:hypothetical protein